MKKPKLLSALPSFTLLSNYSKTSFRSFTRNKLSSGINLFGLGAGLFVSLLIAQYALYEMSFDKFHKDYRQTYRVSYQRMANGEMVFNGATTFLPVGTEMLNRFPEVINQCRFYYPFTHAVINYNDVAFHEDKPVFTDPSYFEIFSFRLLKGSPATALSEPNSIVLSEDLSNKYFGTEDPIDQFLKFSFEDGEAMLRVSGVLENPREDSHLQLNMLISLKTLDQWPAFKEGEWTLPFYHTYIQLAKGTSISGFEQRSASILKQFRIQDEESGAEEKFLLQPLKDIHLDSNLTFELGNNGNRQAIHFLILVAAFILLIAYLNYVNLATALASRRAREVGVRKVLGSFKGQILHQFLTESFIINLGSLAIAIAGLFFSLNYFSKLFGVHFEFSTEPIFWAWILAVVLLGALLSGLYPALVLSSYQPITVLKGKFSNSSKGSFLRKALLATQFVITAIMIGGAILVYQQTDFLLSKDVGFDADKLLVINAPRILEENNNFLSSVRNFGNDAISNPGIESFTHSGSVPGKVMSAGSFTRIGNVDSKPVSLHVNTVDYGYFNTYKLPFSSGRPFSMEFPSDREGVILNESAMNALGIEKDSEIHTEKLMARGQEFGIIGVVKNHHHTSLKTSYEPIVYVLRPERTVYISLNVHSTHLPQTLSTLEESMKRYFPNNPFEYFFLDQVFAQEFKEDMRYADLFRGFSILAIILAGMGLFGMASFLITQKKQEIGIRKVLGATGRDLFALLSASFLVPILSGSFIACLLLYFGGNLWLQDFPFRIELSYPVFLGPLIIVFIITGITLGIQTLKAVKIQPIQTLRNE